MDMSAYFDEVIRIASNTATLGGDRVTAAALGMHLRKAHPSVDWKSYGFKKLSDLLADPFFSSTLELVKTEKGALAVAVISKNTQGSTPHVETYNPLRKAVWEAFTLPSPPGRRFFNRLSGAVRIGLDATPTPADDWIELEKVGLPEQRRWAECFVEEQLKDIPSVDDARNLVHLHTWHPHQFGLELEKLSEGLMRQWNLYRSARVSAYVKKWLADQNLPIDWAFQTKLSLPEPAQVETSSLPWAQEALRCSPEETKRLILAALSQLPVEQLLEIPIPSRLILSALSSARSR